MHQHLLCFAPALPLRLALADLVSAIAEGASGDARLYACCVGCRCSHVVPRSLEDDTAAPTTPRPVTFVCALGRLRLVLLSVSLPWSRTDALSRAWQVTHCVRCPTDTRCHHVCVRDSACASGIPHPHSRFVTAGFSGLEISKLKLTMEKFITAVDKNMVKVVEKAMSGASITDARRIFDVWRVREVHMPLPDSVRERAASHFVPIHTWKSRSETAESSSLLDKFMTLVQADDGPLNSWVDVQMVRDYLRVEEDINSQLHEIWTGIPDAVLLSIGLINAVALWYNRCARCYEVSWKPVVHTWGGGLDIRSALLPPLNAPIGTSSPAASLSSIGKLRTSSQRGRVVSRLRWCYTLRRFATSAVTRATSSVGARQSSLRME